jgi:hypothetical protein
LARSMLASTGLNKCTRNVTEVLHIAVFDGHCQPSSEKVFWDVAYIGFDWELFILVQQSIHNILPRSELSSFLTRNPSTRFLMKTISTRSAMGLEPATYCRDTPVQTVRLCQFGMILRLMLTCISWWLCMLCQLYKLSLEATTFSTLMPSKIDLPATTPMPNRFHMQLNAIIAVSSAYTLSFALIHWAVTECNRY